MGDYKKLEEKNSTEGENTDEKTKCVFWLESVLFVRALWTRGCLSITFSGSVSVLIFIWFVGLFLVRTLASDLVFLIYLSPLILVLVALTIYAVIVIICIIGSACFDFIKDAWDNRYNVEQTPDG